MEEFSGTGGQLDFGMMAFIFASDKKEIKPTQPSQPKNEQINRKYVLKLMFIGYFAITLRSIRKHSAFQRNKWIVMYRPHSYHCVHSAKNNH